MAKSKSPHPVDIHVGRRVRIRRVECGMSQSKLAEQLGLTFQQLQKYESGANRISASRLWQIAQILDVPIGWYFEGLDDEPTDVDVSMTSEALAFASAIQSLPVGLRKSVQQAVKAISDTMAE